jgi:hypothetical protein
LLRFLDHTQLDTHNSLYGHPGRVVIPSHRPLPIQHTTNTRDENPRPQCDSNPQPQQSSGRRLTALTALPLEAALGGSRIRDEYVLDTITVFLRSIHFSSLSSLSFLSFYRCTFCLTCFSSPLMTFHLL